MSNNTTEVLYVKIPSELKKRVKIEAINLGIDQKDFIILALENYFDQLKNVNSELT